MDHGYPLPRPDARGDGTPRTAPRYEQLESSPEVTCGNTDALVFQFSGRPDTIDLTARLFAAIFTFQDEMGVTLGSFLVGAGVPYPTMASANRVLARNALADSNAVVMVVGKWTASRIETEPNPEQRAAVGP